MWQNKPIYDDLAANITSSVEASTLLPALNDELANEVSVAPSGTDIGSGAIEAPTHSLCVESDGSSARDGLPCDSAGFGVHHGASDFRELITSIANEDGMISTSGAACVFNGVAPQEGGYTSVDNTTDAAVSTGSSDEAAYASIGGTATQIAETSSEIVINGMASRVGASVPCNTAVGTADPMEFSGGNATADGSGLASDIFAGSSQQSGSDNFSAALAGSGSVNSSSQSGLIINVNYDASCNNAPAAFKTEIVTAVQFFESHFSDSITISINVGYGEVAGQALSAGALGESQYFVDSFTYSQLKSALISDATSASDLTAIGHLSNSDPTNGGTYWLAQADAKALGLFSGAGIDGYVGFSSTANWDYNNGNGVPTGQYDFYGTVAHEISEVMGRELMVGQAFSGTTAYTPLDLFHYSAPGVRDFVGTQAGYFSIDGGATNLNSFNTNPGGDFGDWTGNTVDSFDAFISSGVVAPISAADLTVLDAIGWNVGQASSTPIVSSVSAIAGDYSFGKTLTLTLNMSAPVNITGAPTLTLNDGGTATFASGAGSNKLTFSYVVGNGQNTSALAVTAVNGTITDLVGNVLNAANLPETFTGVIIDTTTPAVSSVAASGTGIVTGNGDLAVGSVVTLTLSLSEAVTVTGGIPTLTLNDGGTATYTAGSGTNALKFSYTVAGAQNTPDLTIIGVNPNGATVADGAGNAANLTGAVANPAGTLQIDTTPPTVLSVAASGGGIVAGSGDIATGGVVALTLYLSEVATVAGGIPTLSLNDGGAATYIGGSGTNALTFSYTVAAGQNTPDLTVTKVNLNSAVVADAAGNAADLTGAVTNPTGTLQIDTTPPTITQVVASPASGIELPGTAITVTLDFDKTVVVTGAPTLTLNDGGTASYASGSGNSALTFNYTVGVNDRTANLAIVTFNEPTGVAIQDALGHSADLSGATNGAGTGLQIGTIANGTIIGGPGTSTFYALATNLAFNGTSGHGTVVFDGSQSQYNVIQYGDGSITISDSMANRDGTHHLINIEDMQFIDKSIFVESSSNSDIARLYSAALGRAPDMAGLSAWEDAYSNLIPTVAKAAGVYVALAEIGLNGGGSIASGFTQSVEFQLKYGILSDSGFVTQLYQNVLGRGPDPAGLASWLQAMTNGATREYVLVGFAESAENTAKTSADWLMQSGIYPTATIAAGTTLELASAYAGSISFAAAIGTLKIDSSLSFSGAITGQLSMGDAIDLADVTAGPTATIGYSGNNSPGTLTVSDGTHTANIGLLGNYSLVNFTASSDGHGGTLIIDPPLLGQSANGPSDHPFIGI